MSNLKGGRGHTAPYQQTHMRIPLPLKSQVARLVEQFRLQAVDDYEVSSDAVDYRAATKAVNEFIEEQELGAKMQEPRRFRDVKKLSDFLLWLQRKEQK